MPVPASPFGIEPVARVPLAQPPLDQVICQVRFPQILAIRMDDALIPFQEALRDTYPVLRKEQERAVEISDSGIQVKDSGIVWRLHDEKEEYKVSLGPGFIALDVHRYESRDEFTGRMEAALNALVESFNPKRYDRIGTRYIDRVDDPQVVDNLGRYVRRELIGAATSQDADVTRSVGEATAVVDGRVNVRARWGIVQAGEQVDPRMPPVDNKSWFLDTDVFSGSGGTFDVSTIMSDVALFAGAAYRFFRWAVTDEFLSHFGGDV
jgi:uncharacterized protein (TIGR04255 family)